VKDQRRLAIAILVAVAVFGLVLPLLLLVLARDVLFNPIGWLGSILGALLGAFLPAWLVGAIQIVLGVIVILLIVPGFVTVGIWLERKVFAWMQDRRGPNRVGPWGILQSIADVVKLLAKEDVVPGRADRLLHLIAPMIALGSAMLTWAVIPWGPGLVIADLDVGALFVIAMGGLPTIAMIMAGWASNNKYALLGGMRAAAQFISYEIPAVLALMTPVLLAGTLSLSEIVEKQRELGWFILWFPIGPIAFILFLISGLAEVNRSPFDLVEAESEIIAGFHIEYSGMRWGLFMLAEYANAFAVSAVLTTLFLGGYLGLPVLDQLIPPYLWFIGKVWAVMFIMFWVRVTMPRFRYDQLMHFAWKRMLPIALVNIGLTGVAISALQTVFPGLAR
jgi:NADH-quinone oxidoreductase subunit H